MILLLLAFLLGFVAGLRTFTAPAVLWLLRHGGVWAYVLGFLALAEYAADLNPRAPARTGLFGIAARMVSGAFCGWAVTSGAGTLAIWGAVIGAGAAVLGAYSGLAVRMKAISVIGRVPAALVGDLVAIVIAVLAVQMI